MLTPVLHVDMDAFYASVATRDRPELAVRPVIVGGGSRGVVLSANYAARQFGVRSGQPMTRARRMCSEAMVIAPDFEAFARVSRAVMETFREVTPVVEVLSGDEAFLDISGVWRRWGADHKAVWSIAEHLRAVIADEQQINCSVGAAQSMSVAKIASRQAKPDGIVVVPPDQVTAFLHPLDVGELYGVGEKTREALHRLGLMTVADLAHTSRRTLQRALGERQGAHLYDLAWGIDGRAVAARRGTEDPERSMGSDETFPRDIDDPEVVTRELLRLSGRVSGRMRAAGVAGRTVTLRLRLANFTTLTRSRTMTEPTDVTREIYRTAVGCFEALRLERARIRLVGVRVEGLLPRQQVHRQLVLGERERGWAEADQAVDRAVRRFGATAVRPASLLG